MHRFSSRSAASAELGKWDRKTQKIQVWRVPTQYSMPYGMDVGRDDTPVLAELYGFKVAVSAH